MTGHLISARRRSRAAGALVAATLATLGLLTVGSPASATAQPVGDCTTTAGVILAVDFSHWGGPVLRSCGTTPTTGLALLNQGGWHTTGTGHDGPAFVCRIAYSGYHGGTGYPTPRQDPCERTPPATAYWSYWHADPGQHTWSYSALGATGYHPKPGSVDLWSFGATNTAGTSGSGRPSISPDKLRAHNTAPTGGGPGPTPTTAGATTGSTAPAHRPGATTTTHAGPAAPRTTPASTITAAPSPDSAASSGPPPIVDAPPAAASGGHVSHGSAEPAIIALVIVLLLAAGGIAAVLRRPRRER